MILVTMTINAVDYQISTRQLSLETAWNDDIIDAGNISYQLASKYGGYAKPSFGEIELKPSLFSAANWPPPDSCAVVIEYTASTEAAAEELFAGTAHLRSFDREGVVYDLYQDEYDSYLDAGAIADDLDDVFTTYTGGAYLNLTLNTTYARATAPAVSYTTTSKQTTIQVLSDIAQFFSHLFYIRGTTLYLVDMLRANGSEDIDEFDFYPARYEANEPYSIFLTDVDSVDGSYPYGGELNVTPVCHTLAANRELALADIKTIIERQRTVIEKPIDSSSIPVPGMRFNFLDESTVHDIDVAMFARNITFDMNTEDITIEGDFVTVAASPSASPSATASSSPSASASGSPSASPESASASPSGTVSGSPSSTVSASPSSSPSHTVSASPSGSVSGSPSASPSGSKSASPSGSPSHSASSSPSHSPSISPSSSPSPSPSTIRAKKESGDQWYKEGSGSASAMLEEEADPS